MEFKGKMNAILQKFGSDRSNRNNTIILSHKIKNICNRMKMPIATVTHYSTLTTFIIQY